MIFQTNSVVVDMNGEYSVTVIKGQNVLQECPVFSLLDQIC